MERHGRREGTEINGRVMKKQKKQHKTRLRLQWSPGPTPKGNPASDPRPHPTRPCPFARKVPVLAPEEAGRSLGRGNMEDETPTPVLCEKDDALDPGTTSRASSHAFPQPSHNRARPQAIALRGAHTPGSHKNRVPFPLKQHAERKKEKHVEPST
jgi:hypothetical protein